MVREKTITIEAPEKILFTYSLADTGARAAAFLLDLIIQGLLLLACGLIIFFAFLAGETIETRIFEDLSPLATAFFYLALFFLQWIYFIFFEIVLGGRSPGKKLLKLRVLKLNGEPLDFSSIVLRNLLRAVDNFPLFHILGGLISIIDKRSRRLGDLVAGTIVVYDHPGMAEEPDFTVKLRDYSPLKTASSDLLTHGRLTERDLYIIRRFFNQRYKLPPGRLWEISEKLAEDVARKLGYSNPLKDNIEFLETVYKVHANEND
jgi:uncharacterized RDD family membrane protein YckC